jgi:Flp pilus assembly protein TadD
MMGLKNKKQKKELAAVIARGRELRRVGRDPEEALEFLEVAVRRFPTDPELRLLNATILLVFDPDQAAAEAAKAIELSPDDPAVLVRAGHLLVREDPEAARSCAVRANELAPPDFVLMSGLISLNGLIAAFDGEDDVAEERLRLAVSRDPLYSNFAVQLATFLAPRERQEEAVEVIDEALQRTKQKADLEQLRAVVTGKAP